MLAYLVYSYVEGKYMPEKTNQIVIVGAGIGALSAAIHLAAQGHRVQIFERQGQVGGKLNQVKARWFYL